jgi:hypothetical protein
MEQPATLSPSGHDSLLTHYKLLDDTEKGLSTAMPSQPQVANAEDPKKPHIM